VTEAVAAMSVIEASSQEMSKIIGVIRRDRLQTNLLALNAGARGGFAARRAGKGCWVGAGVRKLAQTGLQDAAERHQAA